MMKDETIIDQNCWALRLLEKQIITAKTSFLADSWIDKGHQIDKVSVCNSQRWQVHQSGGLWFTGAQLLWDILINDEWGLKFSWQSMWTLNTEYAFWQESQKTDWETPNESELTRNL